MDGSEVSEEQAVEIIHQMAILAGEERRRIESSLADIFLQREVKRSADKEDKKLTEAVVHWLTTNREKFIDDMERGYEAEIQESSTKTYDVLHMPPDLVVALAQRGALKVDMAVLKALKGKAADIDKAEDFADEGKVTVKLIVRKKDR